MSDLVDRLNRNPIVFGVMLVGSIASMVGLVFYFKDKSDIASVVSPEGSTSKASVVGPKIAHIEENNVYFRVPPNTSTVIRSNEGAYFSQRYHLSYAAYNYKLASPSINTILGSSVFRIPPNQEEQMYAVSAEHEDGFWKKSFVLKATDSSEIETIIYFEDSGDDDKHDEGYDLQLKIFFE